jgi:hypothetical protein
MTRLQDTTKEIPVLGFKRLLPLATFIVVVAALVSGTAKGGVTQTPSATGCPAGFELLNIAALEASGPYPDSVFGAIDRAGNNNGYICGNPQPDAVLTAYCRQGAEIACELQAAGLPHYVLKDDDSPAQSDGKNT